MTALLTIRLAGSVVHSCGASCHEAISPPSECACCCDSANHGVGLTQAVVNTRRMWAEWVARGREAGELDAFELGEAVLQEPLFTIGDCDDRS